MKSSNVDSSVQSLPEKRAVASLSMLYAFRMLGLFMVLPVLALYGEQYEHSSPALLGLALGAYGCSQALLQIPFGMLSDRFGRKPIIALGLVIFALGSLIAANSESVYGLIVGRFLQGGGAIASAIMALVSDLTSEEGRTKAMASIGASIGLSFSLALVLGPLLGGFWGLAGLFGITAALAVVGLVILAVLVPAQPKSCFTHRDAGAVPELLISTLSNTALARLNFGIFTLHAVLMAAFLVLPVALERLGVARTHHWYVYLPLLLLAFVTMLPLVIVAEKKRQMKPVFVAAVALLGLALVAESVFRSSLWGLLAALFLFFVAFNLLEATLPSLVSKVAPAGSKGTAMGLYSTCQFAGAFVGGAGGGWLMQSLGVDALYWAAALLVGCWFVVALGMAPPRHLTGVFVSLEGADMASALERLNALPGVCEVALIEREKAAYLKVDGREFDRSTLASVIT